MGRPALRLGQHGKVTRTPLSPGVWEARCYFRDLDGVTRRPRRQTPRGVFDRHGAAAEEALLSHLAERRAAADADGITGDSLVSDLLDAHLDKLRAEGKAPRTLDTYRLRVTYWNAIAAGLRVSECDPGRIYRLLERIRDQHGHTTSRQLRGLLVAVFDAAVRDGALDTNPASAVKAPPPKRDSGAPRKRGGAEPIDIDQLPAVLAAVVASEECRKKDLTDPILAHLATGLRVSEILGLRWADFDPDTRTLAVTGRVIRAKGQGLLRTPTVDSSKGTAPRIALPSFAVEMLIARAAEPRPNKLGLIFPSSVGTLWDTNNFAKQWRGARANLGAALENSTGHSFRKTLGNLVTDSTSDPRIAADVLGHKDTRTTLKHYLQRGRVHQSVADLVDAAVSKTDHKPTITRGGLSVVS